jgi:hypothetical protein
MGKIFKDNASVFCRVESYYLIFVFNAQLGENPCDTNAYKRSHSRYGDRHQYAY